MGCCRAGLASRRRPGRQGAVGLRPRHLIGGQRNTRRSAAPPPARRDATATRVSPRRSVASRAALVGDRPAAANAHNMSLDFGSSMQRRLANPCARRHGQGCSPGSTREARPRSCPAHVAGIPARGEAAGKAAGKESRQRGFGQVPCGRPCTDEAAVSSETTTTVSSNLMADPERRCGAAGVSVAQCGAAFTSPVQDRPSGRWRDWDTLFLRFRRTAQNVAQTPSRGQPRGRDGAAAPAVFEPPRRGVSRPTGRPHECHPCRSADDWVSAPVAPCRRMLAVPHPSCTHDLGSGGAGSDPRGSSGPRRLAGHRPRNSVWVPISRWMPPAAVLTPSARVGWTWMARARSL